MSIIAANSLNFQFGAGTKLEKKILKNVSFFVEKGEILGVVGHMGCGKSTLVRHLGGLLKPSSGEIFFKGENIWAPKYSLRQLRTKVGVVFQQPEHQLFEETVGRDIAFGPKNMGLSEKEICRRVRMAAEFVGLSGEVLKRSVFEISGGEKRRAAVAGVIAMEPEVLVLDEPTVGLDPRGKTQLMEGLLAYRRERGATLLVVSHSMEDIAEFSERILVLNAGKVEFFGCAKEVFSKEDMLIKSKLEIPTVLKITNELRRRGLPISEPSLTVDEAVVQLLKILGNEG